MDLSVLLHVFLFGFPISKDLNKPVNGDITFQLAVSCW